MLFRAVRPDRLAAPLLEFQQADDARPERSTIQSITGSQPKDYLKSILLDSPTTHASATQVAAWTVLVNTLYNLDITKTRE